MFRRPASTRLALLRAFGLGGVVASLLGVVPIADAQYFPSEPYTLKKSDDFNSETVGAAPSGWTAFTVTGTGTPNFWVDDAANVPTQASGSLYWSKFIRDETSRSGFHTILVPNESIDGNSGYVVDQWNNIVIEFDISGDRLRSSQGVAWAQDDSDNDGTIDQGYYFYIENFPTRSQAVDLGQRAEWHLVRREGGVDVEVGSDLVEFDPSDNNLLSIYRDWVYRIRVEWFCGNLRVQAYRVQYQAGACETGCLYGCGSGCDIANPENCWCEIVSWTDTTPLGSGMAGLYGRSTNSSDPDNRWDNVSFSYWEDRCELVCGTWTSFQYDWNADGTVDEDYSDHLEFKFLYDAALYDYSTYTLDGTAVDNDVSAPDSVSCQGWKQLVPLPGPLALPGSNLASLNAFLRPMADSVEMYDDNAASNPTRYWQRDFDNDPASATYNPNPLVAMGGTPIAASLMDAYNEWYVASTSSGGAYETDPLADCRLWYVLLITDGEESCAATQDYVCDSGQAAELFASANVPVYVVGFSEGVSASSPIECVASMTGGQFYSASNASQLSGVLYDVFNTMEERDRSFIGFGVSQPAATASTIGSTSTLLVYPWFIPRNGETIWDGALFAFTVDEANPYLPVTADGALDFAAAHWNAKTALVDRLAEASPTRNIYWGSDPTSWDRVPIAGTTADGTLAAELRSLINPGFSVNDTQLKEIENYITYIYDDGGLTPAPQANERPKKATSGDAHELGDIYHSRPVPVSPPYDVSFIDDYGFVPDTESGAHDYRDFVDTHSKRRRVVLAGANDGMLHAFDGGFFDRDETNFDDEHDAGTGRELFAWVPRAVMPNIYNMVYAAEHQYMVDGHIATGDVWIDPDPSPSPSESDREWRTVALSTMRRGGRGLVALDITQPDPLTGNVPASSSDPGCLNYNGTTPSGCIDEYPKLLWEFSDTADTDGNLNGDLGWTWSTPAIARLAVYNSSNAAEPKDTFVAFFGGGWDFDLGTTGNFIYAVDIETGQTLLKINTGVAMPAPPAVVDSDNDAFDDRVYFATGDGRIIRLQYPEPTDSGATGAGAYTMNTIFDFSGDSAGGKFFNKPVVVPISLDAGGYTFALALGSGDRANLGDLDGVFNRFYFLVDGGQTTAVGSSALTSWSYSALDQALPSDCADTLNYGDGNYGWYVDLREHEKVNNEAVVVSGNVFFTGFVPIHATGTTGGGSGGGGGGGGGGGSGTPAPTCQAAGSGYIYRLWYECGVTGSDGFVDDFNDIPVDLQLRPEPGGGGFIVEVFGTSPEGPDGEGPTTAIGVPYSVTHEMTNWMQE